MMSTAKVSTTGKGGILPAVPFAGVGNDAEELAGVHRSSLCLLCWLLSAVVLLVGWRG